MRTPKRAVDKTRCGVRNRLLVSSLLLSIPAFLFTERRLQTLTPFRSMMLPFRASAARFAPDNSAIVVNSQSGSRLKQDWIAVYEFPSFRERWRVKVDEAYMVRFSPDGERVTMNSYRAYTEWDARTGTPVKSGASRLKDLVWSVETGAAGRRYEVRKEGKGARKKWFLYDTRGGASVFLHNAGEPGWQVAVFTPDEIHLIAVNSKSGSIRCWRTADGRSLPVPGAWRALKPVALYPTPDKKMVALCRDNTVKEIDFSLTTDESNAPARTLSAFPADRIYFGRLLDNGRFLHVTGSRSYVHGMRPDEIARVDLELTHFATDSTVQEESVKQIIDRKTGKVRTFTGWGGETHYEMLGDSGWAVAYPKQKLSFGEMPRNSPMISWANGITRPSPKLHDLRTGDEWYLPDGFFAYAAHTSADGNMMVTYGGERLQIWKLPRRRSQ